MKAVCLAGVVLGAMSMLWGGCARPEPVVIRVMSYNIHHGEGTDGRLDLERIARVIREAQADLVALQEVDRGTARTGRVDQPARLAELTGMQALFEKNIDYEGGEYGNAILSHVPIERHRHVPLPNTGDGEQRGLLAAWVRAGSSRLLFCATHFDFRPADDDRLGAVEVIRGLVRDHPHLPVIVAGDLNALPESRPIRALLGFMRDTCPAGLPDAFTAPSRRPRWRIDYVLFTDRPGLAVNDYRILPESTASDHRPVVAAFTLSSSAR
ncbi:MAG: endonuclease/exonuclease/phosphatase family protein [Phycisphaerae bacterium]|jgi:endonuclease/exonuclease/phosphatase family metal-dependent hydrolase